MSVGYSFDSLAFRNGRVFGWGWYLSADAAAARIELVIEHALGVPTRITCQRSGHRPDLQAAYPDIPHAAGGGFLLQGRLPPAAPGDRCWLEILLQNDAIERLELPGFPDRYLDINQGPGAQLLSRRAIALAMLRRGEVGALAKRGLNALGNRVEAYRRRRRATAPQPLRGAADVIVFDHAMGGGANHFRDEAVAAMLAEGKRVLQVTPHLPSLSYDTTRIEGAGPHVTVRHDTLAGCLAALPTGASIVVNDLVSFDDPLQVLEWIERSRATGGGELDFYLHDYFSICPSWTLTNERHRFCGIPEPSVCAACLPRNDAAFLSLLPQLDIPQWRTHWLRFLQSADRITAFSEASLRLLRDAYPELPGDRLRVRAHDTSYLAKTQARPSTAPELVVGVVGAINVYKGAEMVAEMVRLIEAESLPMRIVVIGSIDGVAPSPSLSVTGRYKYADLPAILEQQRVSLCFLPSICHETFSYVTSELLAMGMPLASFDLGAPAERIRASDLGCIIPEVDAAIAIDSLFRFHERLLADQHRSESPLDSLAPR